MEVTFATYGAQQHFWTCLHGLVVRLVHQIDGLVVTEDYEVAGTSPGLLLVRSALPRTLRPQGDVLEIPLDAVEAVHVY